MNTTLPAMASLGNNNVQDREPLIHVPWEVDKTEGQMNVLAVPQKFEGLNFEKYHVG